MKKELSWSGHVEGSRRLGFSRKVKVAKVKLIFFCQNHTVVDVVVFQYIFILVSQLWCHEFRKYSFNHILKVCKALFKSQHVLLNACKHVTFYKAFIKLS